MFTLNTVTDVTDGYYVGLRLLQRNKNMQNYVTELSYEIITRNQKES
jgi:hypothetical protein